MKRWLIPIIITIVVVFGVYRWAVGFNNKAVELDESISKAWSDIRATYQQRNDLIGELLKIAEDTMNFGQNASQEVIEARSKADIMPEDYAKITPEMLAQFDDAQGELSDALSRLLMTIEQHSELRYDQDLLTLKHKLTDAESAIQVSRKRFNEATEHYNNHVKRFPNTLLAGWFGFEQNKPSFNDGDEGS